MRTKRDLSKKLKKRKQTKPNEYINPFLETSHKNENITSFSLDDFLNQGIFNNKK